MSCRVCSTVRQNLEGAARALREDLLLLNAMIEETADKVLASDSLAKHIESRILKRAKERTEAIAAAAEQARREGTVELSDAAVEIQKAKDRVEAANRAREIAEFDAVATQATSERNQLVQEARQKRERKQLELDYSRDMQEIRSLLHPFITPGIFQPSRDGFASRYRPESMSLSAIGTVGALEQTDEGLNEVVTVSGRSFSYSVVQEWTSEWLGRRSQRLRSGTVGITQRSSRRKLSKCFLMVTQLRLWLTEWAFLMSMCCIVEKKNISPEAALWPVHLKHV